MFSQLTALGRSYQVGCCCIRDTALYELIHLIICGMPPGPPAATHSAAAAVMLCAGVVSALVELIVGEGTN